MVFVSRISHDHCRKKYASTFSEPNESMLRGDKNIMAWYWRILKWGVNFCNNVIEPKPGWGVWGQYLRDKKKRRGLRKKFTHSTSPGSAPACIDTSREYKFLMRDNVERVMTTPNHPRPPQKVKWFTLIVLIQLGKERVCVLGKMGFKANWHFPSTKTNNLINLNLFSLLDIHLLW